MEEQDRLKALLKTGLLDTEPEDRFDRLTRLAATSIGAKIAAISLVDEDRLWLKSKHGVDLKETPRTHSFCSQAISEPERTLVVSDVSEDKRFEEFALVKDDPGIGFYAGVPLVTKSGHTLGTLCVLDFEPMHDFSAEKQTMLEDIAASVMTEIELSARDQVIDDLAVVNTELKHRMGNMYAHVTALISMLDRAEDNKEIFVRSLHNNLTTLAQTQALLASNNWERVSMSKVIETVLAPFRHSTEKFAIKQSEDFDLSPRGAFIMTLVFHELCTNAVKHGALANEDGVVELDIDAKETISLRWSENGKANTASNLGLGTGFGAQLLRRIAPRGVGGEAKFDLSAIGLQYQLTGKSSIMRA